MSEPASHVDVQPAATVMLVRDGGGSLEVLMLRRHPEAVFAADAITPPGHGTARRFDTRFFVAEVPPGQVASHDATETVGSFWATPAEALARGEAGEIQLLIPTIANLRGLARFSSVADLVAAARSIGTVPLAAPRFRGDPTVPAGVFAPLDPDTEPGGPGGPPEEAACPT